MATLQPGLTIAGVHVEDATRAETFEVHNGDVLVVHMAESTSSTTMAQMAQRLRDGLEERGVEGVLCVILPKPGMSIAALDEAMMRAHGWIKAPQNLELPV